MLKPVVTLVVIACVVAPAWSAAPEPRERSAPLFEFHNEFWLNLHQVLLYDVRPRRLSGGPVPESVDPESDPSDPWSRGLQHYREHYASLHLFDDRLTAINRTLGHLDNVETLEGVAIDGGLREALTEAAKTYRAKAWNGHRTSNRAWIDSVAPLVERHGAAIARELTRLFATEWPAEPMEVQVAAQAGPVGAYTTVNPPLITISSLDEDLRGEAALEMVFHEASHELISKVHDELRAECAEQEKRAPRDLWHVILFYTVGDVVKRELGDGYVPYAYRGKLYDRAPGWKELERLLRVHWDPYLAGTVDRATALANLVGALD